MKAEQITEALEQAATQIDVRVRYETMTGDSAGAGGLCKLHGQWTILIDRKSPASDRAALLLEALSGFDFDGIYLAPEIRDALAERRTAKQSAAEATAP